MRFRFGWRKEQKSKKQIDTLSIDNNSFAESQEPASTDIDQGKMNLLIGHVSPEQSTAPRILVFGDPEETGNLYSLFLRFKGYEVFNFPTPSTCALVSQKKCTCPRDQVCADIILVDMEMEDMTGLELIRQQSERGCHVLSWNKALLSNGLTPGQEYEAQLLGCKTMRKPFRLMDLLAWVRACVKYLPPDRKLTPFNELTTSVAAYSVKSG